MLSKLLYLMVFGALGGFLAWLVLEPFVSDDVRRHADWGQLSLSGAVSGGFIGGTIGFATGLSWGTPSHMLRGALLGGGVGILGGMIGITIGQIFYAILYTPTPSMELIMGRILGWSAFGALVGLSEGIVARSPKRMYQGLLGGAIGGGLGGALFDFLALTVGTVFGLALRAEEGAPSRAVALVLVGAGIGLFIGLIELVARQAWVRVLYGRREGKDYPIDRSGAIIGRDELADVPLRGDPSIAHRHAEIQISGGRYMLVAHAPTQVNGQPVVSPVALSDGDPIQIGSFAMVFQLREGSAVPRPRDVVRSPLPPSPPVPAGTCPYCGQRIDPITGSCACTPATAPAPAQNFTTTPVSNERYLIGLDGALAGQRFLIPPTGLTIGRELDNQLVIPDPSVSRHHARIGFEGGAPVLYDLGSTNGSYVNEKRVSQQVLNPGDVVRFGGVRFRVG